MTTRDKFLALQSEMNTAVLERDEEIHSLILGTTSPGGRHTFFIGEPGIAKSLLIRELAARVTGAVKFEAVMARTTVPDDLLGPISLTAYQQGRFERVATGQLQEAHFAFLDEIWKGNSAVCNLLLPILNERLFRDGGKVGKIPLVAMTCASNELPQGEDLNALFDRLHFKHVVHRVQEDQSFEKLLTGAFGATRSATVTLDEIYAAQKEAAGVKVGQAAIDGCKRLRIGLDKEGVRASDRKWRELVAILQAEAWLAGHSEVQADDLAILQHVLWNTPEERKKVVAVVFAVACPSMPRALEIVDLVAEQRTIMKTDPDKAPESYRKIRKLSLEIEALANGPDSKFAQIKEAAAKVKRVRIEVGELVVGG